jgi:hypothetical protein
MSEDLITRLKKELEGQIALIAAAQTEVRQLQLAIAAIEQDRRDQRRKAAAADDADGDTRAIVRRGELRRGLLDCLRNGIVRRSEFDAALRQRGIATTPNSISNALNRMTGKREIRWDPHRKVYLINEEGPDADAAEPLHLNGATADLHSA